MSGRWPDAGGSASDVRLPNATALFVDIPKHASVAHKLDAPELADLVKKFYGSADAALTMTRQVMALFVADAPARLQAITDAVAVHDEAALATAAHALKGSAGNVGAVALQREAAALENGRPKRLSSRRCAAAAGAARTLGRDAGRAGELGLKQFLISPSAGRTSP